MTTDKELYFDWNTLSADDLKMVREQYLPDLRRPDFIITTQEDDGTWRDYLYRWHLCGARHQGAVYLHIQTSDDPERPFHDHPWPNQTVCKAGGVVEFYQDNPPHGCVCVRIVRPGDVVHRPAREAHRLTLAPAVAYSISQFSIGKTVRPWGFWIGTGWYSHTVCSRWEEGKGSIFVWPPGTEKYRDEPVVTQEQFR